MSAIANRIAKKLNVAPKQVEAAIELLEDGNTVPFIARYRKEATNGLTDAHLRSLEKSYRYQKELDERKESILRSLNDSKQLSPELKQQIEAVLTKTELEDLYLPYRSKRKSKAELAKKAGLNRLAHKLIEAKDSFTRVLLACPYQTPALGFDSSSKTIEGARQILIDSFSQDAKLIGSLRNHLQNKALIHSKVRSEKKDKDKKYNDYYDFKEPLKRTPSHRALALFRGRREGILSVGLELSEQDNALQTMLAEHFSLQNASPFVAEILKIAAKKLYKKLEIELLSSLKERAEEAAINVFAKNLHDLLLTPPAGPHTIIGLDPGIRTGIKVTVIEETGKLLDFTTLYPFPPQNDHHNAVFDLAKLATKYNADFIAIGNGTGSRETCKLVDEMLKNYPDLNTRRVLVSEAGASVYSATELAEKELPELDVSLRGAASIARRLQDPLSELVKIEPKAIGVGQYQHDVNQTKLGLELETVVEDCVNHVGVDLNTASSELLSFVAGLNKKTAHNIVLHRNEHGAFHKREELMAVNQLGEKSFQQSAGFLRIRHGAQQLDNTSIHPEAYPLVEGIAKALSVDLETLLKDPGLLNTLNPQEFVDEQFGEMTVKDVFAELAAPGREVRGNFKTATFKEGVESIEDLNLEMILEGAVTNVASFGAFVDIGVHIDALIHRTQFSRQAPPIKVGQVVTVRVIEVDKERKRIGLSMHLEKRKPSEKRPPQRTTKHKSHPKRKNQAQKTHTPAKPNVEKNPPIFNTAMADALAKLKK